MKGPGWRWFDATTEGGNKISGRIFHVHRQGARSGALHVERLNGLMCSERLYSMPEIENYSPKVHTNGVRSVTVSEKLDGTAIMYSPLFFKGEFVEVIRRTRGMPVLVNMKAKTNYIQFSAMDDAIAKRHFKQWKDLVDTASNGFSDAIEELCRTQRTTLVFELYGHMNRHAVKYENDISMALHTMISRKRILPFNETESHAIRFGLRTVRFDTMHIAELDRFLHFRIESLDMQNDPSAGVYRHEGVVVSLNRRTSASLYKVKPLSMQEYFRESGKPTPITIRAELDKMTESGVEPVFDNAIEWLEYIFDEEDSAELRRLFEKEYWLWVSLK